MSRKRLLVAITYHNQNRSVLYKTIRSTHANYLLPDGWASDTVVFTYDKYPSGMMGHDQSVQTDEETLGGKRNAAIKYARAHNYALIAFLDDDDLFGPSWLPNLCFQYERDAEAGDRSHIYHPQWNVLFTERGHIVREHTGPNDPRFDSRDMMFYNPWSALCAFDPFTAKREYRKHKKSDPVYSFEDWSFNLDTWCDGTTHSIVPDTVHYLRIRQGSLGKSTMFNTLEHTKYFDDPAITCKTKHTQAIGTAETYKGIDADLLHDEMKILHRIEPQLWFWGSVPIHHQLNEPVDKIVDLLVSRVGPLHWVSDVYWMTDHNRVGGAEKAMRYVSAHLSRFNKTSSFADGTPLQKWIDDRDGMFEETKMPVQWAQGVQHYLRCWVQTCKHARSLHICNTGPGWQAVFRNPDYYDKIQVYFYLFNSDLAFPKIEGKDNVYDMAEAADRSPMFEIVQLMDRPNFHLITDSEHYANTLAEMLGSRERIHKLVIPVEDVRSMKREQRVGSSTRVLWAGRMDYLKGIDDVLAFAANKPEGITLEVYGGGLKLFEDKFLEAHKQGLLTYGGPYEKFSDIPGEFDLMLFTSEHEGCPNVVKEAIAAGLPVLAKNRPWVGELKTWVIPYEGTIEEAILKYLETHKEQVTTNPFTPEACFPYAMSAFRECLV